MGARLGGWWDANKIGLSPPLIQMPEGWLMIYPGVRQNASGVIYRLGLAPDGDTLRIYYGTADTSIAMATGSVHMRLQWLNYHS